jgi:hypothetical protein
VAYGASFPWGVAGLLITGGHGGTHAQDNLAIVVSFAVNTGAYTLVALATTVAIRHLRKKRKLPKGN